MVSGVGSGLDHRGPRQLTVTEHTSVRCPSTRTHLFIEKKLNTPIFFVLLAVLSVSESGDPSPTMCPPPQLLRRLKSPPRWPYTAIRVTPRVDARSSSFTPIESCCGAPLGNSL